MNATIIQEYNTRHHNSQESLQRLAEDIFSNGTVVEVIHHRSSVTHPDGTNYSYANGSVCYVVRREGFPQDYFISMSGLKVTNITERIFSNPRR